MLHFDTYLLMLSKELLNTIFWVFGMIQPGIELQFPEPLANTLAAKPIHKLIYITN